MRFAAFALFLSLSLVAHAAKTLDIYFVDVEGGQATLIVAPSGQSMLVDTGWPGFNGRDAQRIADATKKAGVKQIDYLVITHYHTDHVGGIAQLVDRIPVKTFVDHGPNHEMGKNAAELWAAYEKAVQTGQRMIVKPGDTIPIKALDVKVVTADGNRLSSPLPGAARNQFCEAGLTFPEDKTENARSLGTVVQFGKFRFIDLGDLTSRKELELACPENLIGSVDVYLTTHHGLSASNAKPIVHGLRPRVAIMNNGAKKGGSPDAWTIIRAAPGLEDLWQLHFAMAGGQAHNAPESMIANLEERCAGNYLKLSANQDGSFSVFNSRNKFQKSYAAKP